MLVPSPNQRSENPPNPLFKGELKLLLSKGGGSSFLLGGLFSELHRSNEDRLILACSRTWAAPEEIAGALSPDLNWEYIMERVGQNRIAALLFYSLEKADFCNVPREVMESLRIKYFVTARHNTLVACEISEIARSLMDAEIQVIGLKGAALSETVYRDTVPRPFGDVDLLIHKADKDEAVARLSMLGYELSQSCHEEFAYKFGAALTYVCDGKMPIDLHWRLIESPYSRYIDVDSLWQRAVSLDMDGVSILSLSPEDLLIHLCLHISKESYAQLLWLIDISETIYYYRETLDWDLLLEKAEQYRIRLLVHNVISLADQLLAPPIPDYVLQQSGYRESSSLEARLFGALGDPSTSRLRRIGITRFLKHRKTRSRTRRLFGELFPDREFMHKGYPGRNIYFSYFLRLWNALRAAFGVIGESLRISMQRKPRYK